MNEPGERSGLGPTLEMLVPKVSNVTALLPSATYLNQCTLGAGLPPASRRCVPDHVCVLFRSTVKVALTGSERGSKLRISPPIKADVGTADIPVTNTADITARLNLIPILLDDLLFIKMHKHDTTIGGGNPVVCDKPARYKWTGIYQFI
jgi:hypothetical protein